MTWNVYLKGKWIDAVWYMKDCDAAYVRETLINHDGYNPNIVIKKA